MVDLLCGEPVDGGLSVGFVHNIIRASRSSLQ